MTTTVAPEITGVHPYADKFPMLSDAELDELAESIRTVGLLHPIIVDPAGLIIDGRNRLEACNRAQVDAHTETYDGDDIAEYVIACNVARRNMSTGARAMSTALVLFAAHPEWREGGRWTRGTLGDIATGGNSESRWRSALSECGVVLDFRPDLAPAVVAGDLELKVAYQQACKARDAERDKLADAARAAQEEADARSYLEAEAPDLLAFVGDKYDTAREARAVYLERNRAEKARIEREQRDHAEAIQRDANRIKAFLSGFDGAYSMRTHPHRDEVLNTLSATERRRFTDIEGALTWPTNRI